MDNIGHNELTLFFIIPKGGLTHLRQFRLLRITKEAYEQALLSQLDLAVLFFVPSICLRTNHSKDSVERYICDFEAVKLLSSKFDDLNTISLVTRLSKSVVCQYLDLLPADS